MVPRVNIFENAGFSFTCGRTKTEVFEYRGTVLIRSSMGKKKAVLPEQGQISWLNSRKNLNHPLSQKQPEISCEVIVKTTWNFPLVHKTL